MSPLRAIPVLLLSLLLLPLSALAQDATPSADMPGLPADYDALGAAFIDAPAPSLPITVTDHNGQEIMVEDISRIVPLNGDLAEIVFALGLAENVVGVDVSATFPEVTVTTLPKIGYQRALSAEGILALEPTVIIGSAEAGPPEVIEQIAGAGVPVVIIDAPETSIDAPAAKIRAVADALGVSDRGDTLATQVNDQIANAQERAGASGTQPRVMFLYVRGQGTQMIAGSKTSADTMITAAGGVNAGAEAGLEGYQPLTAESLAAAQPDVLLLLEAGLESVGGVEGLLEIPGIGQTPAGENGNVLAFDDLYLLAMGPRTGYALDDLVTGFHAETPVTVVTVSIGATRP